MHPAPNQSKLGQIPGVKHILLLLPAVREDKGRDYHGKLNYFTVAYKSSIQPVFEQTKLLATAHTF